MNQRNRASQSMRYNRQMILREFRPDGQEKLFKAKVLVIGAGGLGSPILFYLAAAGVGTIGVADYDKVHISNLNRQILYTTDDLDRLKTESAEEKLLKLNPVINIIRHDAELNAENIERIISAYDVIVDAVDTIRTRYLISDACYLHNKPLVEGAVVGFTGILTTIIPNQTPCYRCLYPMQNEDNEFPTCQEIGILGAIAGTIGSLQALEVIKLIVGIGETMKGRLLVFDGVDLEFQQIELQYNSECILCSDHKTTHSLQMHEYKK